MSALLSREEVDAIRKRADAGEQTADDVRRLLQDLSSAPPLIVIAAEGAKPWQRAQLGRELAQKHRCDIFVLPFGWEKPEPTPPLLDSIQTMLKKMRERRDNPVPLDLQEHVEIVPPWLAKEDETPAETLARHKADDARYEREAATHPATADCPDAECDVCSFRDCPHQHELHYHHDGCPACHGPERAP